MLKKIFIISVAVLVTYFALMIFTIDVMKVRRLAPRNLVGDITENLYKEFKSTSKFPTTISISKEQINKYNVTSYSYKLVSNDNFELVVNIENFLTKDEVFKSNKDGVFILTGKNEWYQVRRGINMKDEKSVEIKR